MDSTPDYRALCASESDELPPGYIDPEHTGQDRKLLEVFYRACRSEGGTADEIHLRGLKAVLALTQPEPEGPTDEEMEEAPFVYAPEWYNTEMAAAWEAGRNSGWRDVLARWGRPAIEPVPVSERLPGPEDCCGNPRNGQGQWCWGRVRPAIKAGTPLVWRLMPRDCIQDEAVEWWPWYALPVPKVQP